jgi:predicted CoA-binding protein
MTESQDQCEMPLARTSDVEAADLLKRYKTIAVVGLSASPEKPSHQIPKYLLEHGYTIIPVNPMVQGEVLGQKAYASLKDIPHPVDIVEIFRLPKDVPPIVEDAIAIGAKAVWMQTGIVHNESAERAKAAGLAVVMDKCAMVVHRNELSR